MSNKKDVKDLRLENMPDVLTLEEAGMYIGYSSDYLRKKSKAKKFPGYQLFDEKGSWRVDKADLKRWLAEKRGNMSEVFAV